MQPTLTSFAAPAATLAPTFAGRQQTAQSAPATLVESQQLLQGNKTVGIMHNGSLYRLQATKLGKLILTK